jgi:hypothetical protein
LTSRCYREITRPFSNSIKRSVLTAPFRLNIFQSRPTNPQHPVHHRATAVGIRAGGNWFSFYTWCTLDKSYIQKAALDYARSIEPLDPDRGWQREDVQIAFMAGVSALPVPRLVGTGSRRDPQCLAINHPTASQPWRACVHSDRARYRTKAHGLYAVRNRILHPT